MTESEPYFTVVEYRLTGEVRAEVVRWRLIARFATIVDWDEGVVVANLDDAFDSTGELDDLRAGALALAPRLEGCEEPIPLSYTRVRDQLLIDDPAAPVLMPAGSAGVRGRRVSRSRGPLRRSPGAGPERNPMRGGAVRTSLSAVPETIAGEPPASTCLIGERFH